MNPDQFKPWIGIQEHQAIALEKIAQLIEQSLPRQPTPNYRAILENFHDFDWAFINAQVELTDRFGVATVIWKGDLYERISHSNSYDAVIYVSRCVGKDERRENQYERPIAFEPFAQLKEPFTQLKVEQISRKTEEVMKC